MSIERIVVVYAPPTSNEQKNTISIVKKTLKKHGIKFFACHRDKLNKKLFFGIDLAIAIGGDGTFLRTSHFISNKTPIFGVNSDPKSKEGFFMSSERKDFEKKFGKILAGDHKIRKLSRLEACIGKKKVSELALNEFYLSSKKEYRTSRYYITIKGKRERQKSSGILVATAAGSYAWMKSAGGKTLPIESQNFEYLVREPYCGSISAKCMLTKGILSKEEKIKVEFELGDGILIADSLGKEHILRAGQKASIKVSNNPLHSIVL